MTRNHSITMDYLRLRSTPEPNSGCWLWDGPVAPSGYVHITQAVYRSGHRLSWFLANGPIPYGLHVLHKCDVRSCVNPDHLFIGTAKDNIRDMMAKGRRVWQYGERNGAHKLTERDVVDILTDRISTQEAMDTFSVTDGCIRAIQTGKRWKHVPGQRRSTKPIRRTTPEMIRAIRACGHRETLRVQADRHGISQPTVCMILSGRAWANIK